MNTKKAGLTVGLFFALWHLIWDILVWVGVAETLIEWKLSMHFLAGPVTVEPFSIGTALGLLLMTFVSGYIIGVTFALLWKSIHK